MRNPLLPLVGLCFASSLGCGLLDGLFGAESVEREDLCETFIERLGRCGDTESSRSDCLSAFSCLDGHREACRGEWREFVRCAYADEGSCDERAEGDDDSLLACHTELSDLVSCASQSDPQVSSCLAGSGPCESGDCPPRCHDEPCPGGMVCDLDGICRNEQCTSTNECGGAPCLSPRSLCEALPERFGVAQGEACASLPEEPGCARHCGRSEDCPEGQRCWSGTEGHLRGGFCGPGQCSGADEGACDGFAGECMEENNGPGSGVCGIPCDPSLCDDEGCSRVCPAEAPTCAPREIGSQGSLVHACAGAGSLGVGQLCAEGNFFSCETGSFCSPDVGTCALFCPGSGLCPNGEACQQHPESPGAYCLDDGNQQPGCSSCGSEPCRSPRTACEQAAGLGLLPRAACEGLPSGESCYAHCALSDGFGCAPGELCYPDFLSPSPELDGFCAVGSCSTASDCAEQQVCINPSEQSGAGLCAQSCSPAGCDAAGEVCQGCQAGENACVAIGDSSSTAFICAPDGPLQAGQSCTPFGSQRCRAGLGCVPNELGEPTCEEYCRGGSCPSGGSCEERALPGGVVVQVCSRQDESCLAIGEPCAGGLCHTASDLCWSDDWYALHWDCAALSAEPSCVSECAGPSSCSGAGERCFGADTVGYCARGGCSDPAGCPADGVCLRPSDGEDPFCALGCSLESCDPVSRVCGCPATRAACAPTLDVSNNVVLSCMAAGPLEPLDACNPMALAECPAAHLCAMDLAGANRCLPVCNSQPCESGTECFDDQIGDLAVRLCK